MTYGEFAWKDLMEATTRERRRPLVHAVFVAGDPVPFMGIRERDWAYRVKHEVGETMTRPRFRFVVGNSVHGGHRFGLDDLCKPVLDVIGPRASSVWAEVTQGDNPGVGISVLSPPYPPRIDRGIVIERTPGREHHAEITKEMALVPPLGGEGPVGAHITLGKVQMADFGYGTPVRVLFDSLSAVLGGTASRPGDTRIRDLRVVRDHTHLTGAIIRLWHMD